MKFFLKIQKLKLSKKKTKSYKFDMNKKFNLFC